MSSYLKKFNPFSYKKLNNNNSNFNENEITLMINDELKSINIKNNNVNKINDESILNGIIEIYNKLHKKTLSNKNSLKNEKLIKLFEKDNKLNEKFVKNSAPYSDYNFFYGLDISSFSSKEEYEKGVLLVKLKLILVISHYPILAGYIFGSVTMGHIMAIFVVSIILVKKALSVYNMVRRKYISKDSVYFCTKYMPFDNMGGFRSRLYEKYHKLFIYDDISNKDKNLDIFLNFIVDKSSEEKSNFELKVKNYLFYINDFMKTIKSDNEKKIKEAEKNIKGFNKIYEEIKNKINEKNIISSQNQKSTNPIMVGGVQEERIRSLDDDLNKDYIKLSGYTNIVSSIYKGFSLNYKKLCAMNYRLNYKISEDTILTSGDLTLFLLNNEFYDILQCYGKYFKEVGVISKKIKFFVNNSLFNELIVLRSCNSAEDVKIRIIGFIEHYIESFYYLYLISEYNIKTLINGKKNTNTLLDKMFEYNLSETWGGRYYFYGEGKHFLGLGSMNETRMKKIKNRDKINYFSMLMKYSYLALDHMFKRLKLVIKQNSKINEKNEKIERINNDKGRNANRINNNKRKIETRIVKSAVNNDLTIYDYNESCERGIIYYVTFGYHLLDKDVVSGFKYFQEKTKDYIIDYNKLKYNKLSNDLGKLLKAEAEAEAFRINI